MSKYATLAFHCGKGFFSSELKIKSLRKENLFKKNFFFLFLREKKSVFSRLLVLSHLFSYS